MAFLIFHTIPHNALLCLSTNNLILMDGFSSVSLSHSLLCVTPWSHIRTIWGMTVLLQLKRRIDDPTHSIASVYP